MKEKTARKLTIIWTISLIFCFVGIILSMVVFSALQQTGEFEVSFSTEEKPFADGDGTQENPYLISVPKHLDNVRYFMYHRNEDGTFDETKPNYFLQTANLNFALEDFNGDQKGNFNPIGTDEKPFPGTYEGGQYTISNLHISSSQNAVGLFGVISSNAKVYRVGLLNSSINASGSGNVGGIAGNNQGVVEQCYSSTTITTSTTGYVGGLVGSNTGTIKNSYNSGNISGTKTGGLVGYNAGVLENGYNSGTVGSEKGGLIHTYSSGSVSNLAFLSSVASNAIYSGGDSVDKTYILSVNENQLSCSQDVEVNGATMNILSLINGNNQSEMPSYFHSSYSLFKYPQIWINTQDFNFNFKGDGSSENPYYITSPQLLSLIGKNIVLSDLFSINLSLSSNYLQPVDINFKKVDTNLSNLGNFDPIGFVNGENFNFEGYYKGETANGKAIIQGIDFDTDNDSIGLFLSVGVSGVVDGIEVSNFSFNIRTPKPFALGGIAATNSGTITNCTSSLNISFNLTQQQFQGTAANIGGIAANNDAGAKIVLCSNLGNINVVYPDNVSVSTATSFVGGISALNSGLIDKCYNSGDIRGGQTGGFNTIINSGATVSNSFNTGDVSATLLIQTTHWTGGLFCNAQAGSTIYNCYNLGKSEYAIATLSDATVTNVFYLDGCASAVTFNGQMNFKALNANQLAGQTPISGTQYILDVLGNDVWEFDWSYLGRDGQAYQFAQLKDNNSELVYKYGMKVNTDGFHVVENFDMFQAITGRYNNILYPGDGKFILMSDIDYSGKTYTPKTGFSGTLNGNGKIIKNVSLNTSTYALLGLFNVISNNAKVYNLGITNCNIQNGVENSSGCGVLAGKIGLGAIIENVYVENSYAYGWNDVGGFCGSNSAIDGDAATGGYIRNCYTRNTHAQYIGNDDKGRPVGGFIGWLNGGDISSCYSMNDDTTGGSGNGTLAKGYCYLGGFVGAQSSGTIKNCFSYGSIYTDRNTYNVSFDDRGTIAGFAGDFNGGNISNCYAHVVITGFYRSGTNNSFEPGRAMSHGFADVNPGSNNYCLSGQNKGKSSYVGSTPVANATEYSTEQLKVQSNFAGWDFNSIWQMSNASTIPFGMPMPKGAMFSLQPSVSLGISTDGNSIIQIWQGNTLIKETTSGPSGYAFVSSLPYGTYQVYIHRYGQELTTQQNISSYAERNIEGIEITLDSSSSSKNITTEKWFLAGEGTQSNPYEITNVNHLLNINKMSNYGDTTFYVLKNNLNLENQTFNVIINNFKGTFDGNGYRITNFKLFSQSGNLGLFNKAENATIKNLGISDFEITNNDTQTGFSGGLVGEAVNSNIISSFAENGFINVNSNAGSLIGKIDGGEIKYSYSTNNVTSVIKDDSLHTSNLGGFIAEATGSAIIKECYSNGNVVGTKRLGGFISNADSVTIKDCYTRVTVSTDFVGDVDSEVGGFAGFISANSSIENCFMYGTIYLTKTRAFLAGLFAGVNNSNALTNVYYWKNAALPAVHTNNTGVEIKGLTTTQFNQASSFNNYDFMDVWGMPSPDSSVFGAPILRNVANAFKINETILGKGTELDPYIIFDEKTLLQMMDYIKDSTNGEKTYFKLQKDIEILSTNWQGIGTQSKPFNGVFDGNGKTISGINFNGTTSTAIGLFSYLDGAIIKNLTITNSSIETSSNISVGSVAGEANNSILENVVVNVGTISSVGSAGALVGKMNGGYVNNSTVSGTNVSGQSAGAIGETINAEISGLTVSGINVNGTVNAGAVVGKMDGGKIYLLSTTSNTLSGNNVGGIVGYAQNGEIKNVVVENLNVTNSQYLGGIAGNIMSTTISGTTVHVTQSLNASVSAGGIAGKAVSSSLDLNTINNIWSPSQSTISATNVGGIVGEAENMVSIKENKFTKLNLKPSSGGFVGQIYGKLTGNSNASNNLYGQALTVDNSAGATFNNMTGSTIQESYMNDAGALEYFNWILVA